MLVLPVGVTEALPQCFEKLAACGKFREVCNLEAQCRQGGKLPSKNSILVFVPCRQCTVMDMAV